MGWRGEARREGKRRAKAVREGHPEWVQYPRTRPRAVAAGVDFFFTGKMCKNRHISLRAVRGSRCVECEGTTDDVSPKVADFIRNWIAPTK